MASIEINKDCLNSWTQLADDKDDTNWFLNLWLYILNVLLSRVLWNYIDGRTPTVKFHSMGNGGLAELREQLNPTDLFYGGFLVKAVDQKQVIRFLQKFHHLPMPGIDECSKPLHWLRVCWQGSTCPQAC